MTDGEPTAAQVVADANALREQLALLERELQEDIDAIDFAAFRERRDLTSAEVAQRREWRATQAEVRDNFRTLAFVTLKRLDDTAEVAHLHQQMKLINVGLADDLARLKKLERYAEITAKVIDNLARAVERLSKVAAKAIA